MTSLQETTEVPKKHFKREQVPQVERKKNGINKNLLRQQCHSPAVKDTKGTKDPTVSKQVEINMCLTIVTSEESYLSEFKKIKRMMQYNKYYPDNLKIQQYLGLET